MRSPYSFLETPCLLIDEDQTMRNIRMMQERARAMGVSLRPHIKTHRMPYFARRQLEAGAAGIACAKIGEAQVMAQAGISDIFLANEVIGLDKYERLRELHETIRVRVGIDNEVQLRQMEAVFSGSQRPLEVLIEYEVGEQRTGVIADAQLIRLAQSIQASRHVVLKGIFSHEGHVYKAASLEDCRGKAQEAYRKTLRAAGILRELGAAIDTVSVGATPSAMQTDLPEGITELRIGTYIFFDIGQANALGDFSRCSATVLASVISKPTDERVVIDAGAKALVSQNRAEGICATRGFGCVKGVPSVRIDSLFDEHGIILSSAFRDRIEVGDKIEVIPSHICPTVNLYDEAYLVSNGQLRRRLEISARGKSL